jgi:polysaccharide biosynthesis protein PslG
MRRAVIPLVLVALLVPAAGPQARQVPKGWLGVSFGPEYVGAHSKLTAELKRMHRSGVESARFAVYWSSLQPAAGQAPDYRRLDRIVAAAARARLPLLPVVLGAPAWATLDTSRPVDVPRNPADYAAFVGGLVQRYGSGGTYFKQHKKLPRVPIRTWQIWNEPHFEDYWHTEGGEQWASHYALLLKDAYKAIKRADPGATVVNTALASFPWRYLKQIYKAGAAKAMDVVAINPFTVYPWSVIRGERLVRKVMRKYHQGRKSIWITEATWPSSKGKAPGKDRASWQLKWETNAKGMAQRLRQVYDLVVKRRKRERIGRVYWYTWATKYDGNDLFDYSGLLSWNGSSFAATRALSAFRASAQKNQGCKKTAAGRCR